MDFHDLVDIFPTDDDVVAAAAVAVVVVVAAVDASDTAACHCLPHNSNLSQSSSAFPPGIYSFSHRLHA